MAITVIGKKKFKVVTPNKPFSGSNLEITNLAIAPAGSAVDLNSWKSNLERIIVTGGNPGRNTWIGFGVDSVKLFNAAAEFAKRNPLIKSYAAPLFEIANQLDIIVTSLVAGNGVPAQSAVKLLSEGLAIAGNIMKVTPAGLAVRIGAVTFDAISQEIPETYIIPGTKSSSPPNPEVKVRYEYGGIDVYKDPITKNLSDVVFTFKDINTNQTTFRRVDYNSGKILMDVVTRSDGTFDVYVLGGTTPSRLPTNPLAKENMRSIFGEPITSTPEPVSSISSDIDHYIAELINQEIEKDFPELDPTTVDFAVLGVDNPVAFSGLDEEALAQGRLVGNNITINMCTPDTKAVLVASADIGLSDSSEGLFTPRIVSVNGQGVINNDLLNATLEDLGLSAFGLNGQGVSGNFNQLLDVANPDNKAGYTPVPQQLDANGLVIPWYKTPAGQQFGAALSLTQNLAASLSGKSSLPLAINAFNIAASSLQDNFPDLAQSLGGVEGVLSDLMVWNNLAQAISKGDAVSIAQTGNAVAQLVIGAYQKTLLNQMGSLYGSWPDTHQTIANYAINKRSNGHFDRSKTMERNHAHAQPCALTRTHARASKSTCRRARVRTGESLRGCVGGRGRIASKSAGHAAQTTSITHESIANY
jgi:hypothetical protein